MSDEPAVMRASGLHHAYGSCVVLDGVDLTLEPGRIAGVVGENGVGKSTLLKILYGELKADRGSVDHQGRIGYCPQQAVLNDAFTVREHLELFKTAYGLRDVRRAEEIADLLNLTAFMHKRAGALSGGTRQKLNLVLSVMHDPHVLLLDEPYQGFDWDTYLRFWELATRLCSAGRSILVVSHLAPDTDRVDPLWRLDRGLLRSSSGEVAA